MEEEERFCPKYFIIPYKIATDKELKPIDSYVYATIFWLGKLRNKKCTASNKRIAKATKNIVEQTVERSLTRLERRGHIKRFYFDKNRRHRKEIKIIGINVKNTSVITS